MNAVTAESQVSPDRDGGAVLLLVLAVAIVLSLVVLALANFVAADLRYSQVVDARAKTLSSAESGIDHGVDRLRLNQTLCATKAAAGSPVSLNGSNAVPVGTTLPTALNGTDTKVTCERLDGDIADVAGWAAVIANNGECAPSDQIQVDQDGHFHLYGPVFLPDPTRTVTDSNSRVELVDGDLWYTRPDCTAPDPDSNSALAAENIDFAPPTARGGIFTTRTSGSVFSEPPVPTLPATPPTVVLDDGFGCRVFSPGWYTAVPDLTGATNVYFKSGDYLFDFNDEWLIAGDNVWAGYPESPGGLGACNDAAAADAAGAFPEGGGRPGATFYFDGNSRVRVDNYGQLEIFPREQDNHIVSVQALTTSTTGNTFSLVRTRNAGQVDLVIHGLVWAPNGRVAFDNDASGSTQQLLGGVVAQRLWILRFDPAFEIRPAKSVVDTRILLTSTSTVDGASTTVEAVVQYRPDAVNLEDRVAVNSYRVVD